MAPSALPPSGSATASILAFTVGRPNVTRLDLCQPAGVSPEPGGCHHFGAVIPLLASFY